MLYNITMTHYLLALFGGWGYAGIFVLMAVESSLIPFPSEVVIPPAGYLASQGQLNIVLVILAGTVGSLAGAWFNYFLARYLGAPLLNEFAESKTAKLILLTPKKLQKAENYFLAYGRSSTFFGRLIPVIRQLISLPAGLDNNCTIVWWGRC